MNTAKRRTITLAVITVVMALSLTFLAPAGPILPDAQQRYLQETLPDFSHTQNAWDYELNGAMGYLASAGLMDAIMPTNDISYLPLTLNEPGRVPMADNFSETGYQDPTLIVEITDQRMYDSTFHIATVKIATPSQLRTAVSNSKYGDPPELLSMAMNAVVLMNGDFYTKTSSGNGYIVRQTEVYRWKASTKTDLLLIDENSDLHIIQHGDSKSVEEDAVEAFLKEHEIINAFYFGPALVVDGVKAEIPKEYLGDPHSKNPRAAIGQLAPLTYVMVTVDGRTDESEGVTVEELAAFMNELGCTQAYAMDGGNSSILVFNHQMLSNKGGYDTRSISDVIFFASAIDN